jgi:stage V sporulation protein R
MKMYTFGFSGRNDRFEIESRDFKEVKEKMLFQLTNFGNPYIRVVDSNYANRGELLLEHQHAGMDLRPDYARETLSALVRVWKRPVAVATKVENKPVLLRYDGKEHASTPYKV